MSPSSTNPAHGPPSPKSPRNEHPDQLNTNATTRTPPPRRRCRWGFFMPEKHRHDQRGRRPHLQRVGQQLARNARKGPGEGSLIAEGHGEHARKDFDLASRAEHLARAHRLVSYRVSTTPPGNVRVSTRFRFTQLSSAVKNGVPPPTRTG